MALPLHHRRFFSGSSVLDCVPRLFTIAVDCSIACCICARSLRGERMVLSWRRRLHSASLDCEFLLPPPPNLPLLPLLLFLLSSPPHRFQRHRSAALRSPSKATHVFCCFNFFVEKKNTTYAMLDNFRTSKISHLISSISSISPGVYNLGNVLIERCIRSSMEN